MKKLVISRINHVTGEIDWSHEEIISKEQTAELFQKEYIPQAKDRLYIFPGCTIPRFKLKGMCEKYNIAISKTREKANIFIADPKSEFEKTYFNQVGWGFSAMRKPLLDFLRKSSSSLGELLQNMENLEEDVVIISHNASYTLSNQGLNGIKYVLIDEDDVENGKAYANEINALNESSQVRHYASDEAKAEFLAMTGSKTLYHQDAILKLINASAATIDESMYQSLRSMFNTKQDADIQVAMEAMANSDIESSITYLLLLYKEFGAHQLYNHPSKHHVNFKSLTKYLLGNTHNMHNLDIDNCVEILRDKKLLTSRNLEVFMTEAKQIVRESGETEYFKVTDVVPREDIQKIVEDTDAALTPKEPLTAL